MATEINTIILEDDFFSRNWMALILARDWRTRLAADVATVRKLNRELRDPTRKVDLVILDAEIYRELSWIGPLLDEIAEHPCQPKVVFTAVSPLLGLTHFIGHPAVRGYLIKGDIQYSLAWGVAAVGDGDWVLTPSVEDFLSQGQCSLPRPRVVMEGQDSYPGLTTGQANTARLAILFSMERADLADELIISENWTYGKMTALYDDIGIKDLLAGTLDLDSMLGDNPIFLEHFRPILASFKGSPGSRAKSMETLAFHLLTRPYYHRIS